jgi:uncharacterized protein YigA (DUF484 family)
MKAVMKAEDIAEYLQNNPAFFETYSRMLSEVVIPHPYGGRTISLSERQMVTLRERAKELEKKLHELVAFGKENDALQSKLHLFTVALLHVHDVSSLQSTTVNNLREIFAVPHAAIQLWKENPPSVEVLAFADQHAQPVCLHHAVFDTAKWFGEAAEHLRSFAYMPLRANNQSIGMLIIASEDAQRFYPEMGTVFLQRIADIVSAALSQHTNA